MQPEIKIGLVANLFSRMMYFKNAGDVELGHTHQFDHLTLLAHGSLQVKVDGETSTFTAPQMIYIHKDKNHELVALADDTVAYCIHALRDEHDNIIDPASVPAGVRYTELAAMGKVGRLLGDDVPPDISGIQREEQRVIACEEF